MTIEVPRDREGTFEPKIVEKHQTRFDGFDDKIVSMYARGMTVRGACAPLRLSHAKVRGGQIQDYLASLQGAGSGPASAAADQCALW